MRVLTEPRNAVTRQFQKFLQLDKVDLVFTDGAIAAASELALARKTGARALRSIVEESLLDVMYDIPERTDVRTLHHHRGDHPRGSRAAAADQGGGRPRAWTRPTTRRCGWNAAPSPTRGRAADAAITARRPDRMRAMDRWAGVILGVVAGLVYLVVGPDQVDTDSHWPIAQAFVAGRLHLVDAIPWVELVPRPGRRLVLALPAAAVGAAGAVRRRRRAHLDRRQRRGRRRRLGRPDVGAPGPSRRGAGAPGGADARLGVRLGAAVGRGHRVASTWRRRSSPRRCCWVRWSWASTGAGRCWPGCCWALPRPRGCRSGLALPLLLYLYRRGGWAWVLVGVAIPAAIVAGYNLARFGDPLEFGYGLIADVDGNSVLDESWYPHGIDSIWYIPQGLYTMLLKGVDWQDDVALGPARLGRHVGAADDAHPVVGRSRRAAVWRWSRPSRAVLVHAARPGARQPGLRPGRLPLHRGRAAVALDAAGHRLPGRPDAGCRGGARRSAAP